MKINPINTSPYNYFKNSAPKSNFADKLEEKLSSVPEEEKEASTSETKSDIIVKADGSRVLVMTMSVGGMQTTTSMEISKPTDFIQQDNNTENVDAQNDLTTSETDSSE